MSQSFKDALTNAIKEQENTGYGANNMPAFKSSLNALVDLYSAMGGLRQNPEEFINLFEKAIKNDLVNTFKLLFLLRNIRGGLGERNLFRVALSFLEKNYKNELEKVMHLIPVYGRWDDLFQFEDKELITKAINLTLKGLEDPATQQLVAKWLPINNAKGNEKRFVSKLRTKLNKTPKEYRKYISGLRNVVEQKMCANRWKEVDYSKTPSLAMTRYREAFKKHDEEGLKDYISKLQKGEAKVNTGAIYPYDLLNIKTSYGLTEDDLNLIDEQWKNLPDYLQGSKVNILPMVDVSGSMEVQVSGGTTAMDVAISLGMYLSQRNESEFKNILCSFSEKPALYNLEMFEETNQMKIFEKIRRHDIGYSTDLEKALIALVDFGVANNLSKEDMPEVLLMISDMNFNEATRYSNGSKALELVDKIYQHRGYKMPKVVFWNVNHNGLFSVKFNKEGVAMVSGFSPAIVTSVLSEINDLNPVNVMLKSIEPYQFIEDLLSSKE